MKILISTVLGVLFTAGSALAMVCEPNEVPVKTKVEMIDVNGNVVVSGAPGCAQSVSSEGRVRVIVQKLMKTDAGVWTQVSQIDVLPSEIVGR